MHIKFKTHSKSSFFLHQQLRKMLSFICLFSATCIFGQKNAIKTNILGDMTTSINIGIERMLWKKTSLEVVSSINLWEFSNDRKFKHVLVQPSMKYWFCEFRNGWFVGGHAHWGHYNVGGIKLPFNLFSSLKHSRYQGDLWGGGVSTGYSWILSKHFDVEIEVGLGYAHLIYDKYPCRHCSLISDKGRYNYWGPTKLGVNLVYSF